MTYENVLRYAITSEDIIILSIRSHNIISHIENDDKTGDKSNTLSANLVLKRIFVSAIVIWIDYFSFLDLNCYSSYSQFIVSCHYT